MTNKFHKYFFSILKWQVLDIIHRYSCIHRDIIYTFLPGGNTYRSRLSKRGKLSCYCRRTIFSWIFFLVKQWHVYLVFFYLHTTCELLIVTLNNAAILESWWQEFVTFSKFSDMLVCFWCIAANVHAMFCVCSEIIFFCTFTNNILRWMIGITKNNIQNTVSSKVRLRI